MTVKSSLGVAAKQQSWRHGNHRASRTAGAAMPWRYRQAVEGPQAGPFAPDDFRLIYRKRQIGPAPEQGFQRAPAFDARELMAEAEMDPGTEGDVAVRCPFRPHPRACQRVRASAAR